MRRFSVIEWGIYVPSLELGVASFKSLLAWRISMIVVASSTRCEVLDAIVIITLVTFAN
jgi:hypothetical protein